MATAPAAIAAVPATPKVSFFRKLLNEMEGMFKKSSSVEVQVSSALNYTAPFLEEAVDLLDPSGPQATAINLIIDKVKTGMAALAVTIQDSKTGAGSASAKSILASITTNMAALESAAQVKDPATQAKLTGLLQLVNGEISAIQTAVG